LQNGLTHRPDASDLPSVRAVVANQFIIC